ncbi:MAG: 5'-3' exonuclease, partial [Actinomycetota bacterium]
MIVHLVDGTYELFRYHFAVPSAVTEDGREVGGTRGVLGSMLSMLEAGATHVGIATDHVIESFRNALLESYKSGEGVDPAITSQFGLLEDTLRAAGFCVWPMEDYEADDALGAAAVVAAADPRVERVMVCSPDKDLAQCVTADGRVVQYDRRKESLRDFAGVIARFGVEPASIPDYLALVGDTADGIPGVPGWGSKTAAVVLARYKHLEDIPTEPGRWEISVRGRANLLRTLADRFDDALLYRRLATLDTTAPTITSIDELRWTGPRDGFEEA